MKRRFLQVAFAMGIGIFGFISEAIAGDVDSIWSPPDTVTCLDLLPVTVVIGETGSGEDSVGVEFLIDDDATWLNPIYADSAKAFLPGSNKKDTIDFVNWLVPLPPPNTYYIRVLTFEIGDIFTEDTLFDTVSVICPGYRDVGVDSIGTNFPPAVVDSNDVVNIRAWVTNYGGTTETINVYAVIANYADTQIVTGLIPGNTETVFFDAWTVNTKCDSSYILKIWTGLPGDANPWNDTLTKNVYVRCPSPIIHDVGVVSINLPPAAVDSGNTSPVQVTVKNFGNVTESFNVSVNIDGYSDTRNVSNLDSDSLRVVNFNNWVVNVPCDTSYKVTVATLLSNDGNSSNDTMTQNVYVRCLTHDVGVVSIDAPPAVVDSGSTDSVKVTVANFGERTETFNVYYSVAGFYDTVIVTSLVAGDTFQITTFSLWTIDTTCDTSYTLIVSTLMAGDDIPTNNTRTKDVFVRCITHDVGVVSITAPPSVVNSGDTVPVSAWVKNFGDTTDTFNAFYSVGIFSDTVTGITLNKAESTLVNFTDWTVPSLPCDTSYTLAVATILGSDIDPYNNIRTKDVFVECITHDVGVVSVDAPSPVEVAGDTVMVQATVRNFGKATETFYVRYTVPGFADSQQVVGLMPDSSRQVTLPSWVIPPLPCDQPDTVIVTAVLSSDIHPNDNTKSHNVYVKCPGTIVRDVGVVSVDAPSAIVDAGDTVTVIATVQNFGDTTETFYVRYLIDGVPMDSQQITNLLPDSSRQDTFLIPWVVPNAPCDIAYTLRVSTLLPDFIPFNNTLDQYVYAKCPPGVIHNVGVDSIITPGGTVAAGGIVTPEVLVRNSGTLLETFDVSLVIGNYADTMTVTVPGDTTLLVTFNPWSVDSFCPLNYLATAEVVLSSDTIQGNNRKIQSVLAECGLLPALFTIISPVDGTFFDRDSVDFVWNLTTGPGPGMMQYRLLISSDTTFDSLSLMMDTIVTDTTISLTLRDNSYNYWRVEAFKDSNNIRKSIDVFQFSIVTKPALVPLFLNFPNPVEGSGTTIKYSLSKTASVTIRLFDVSGQMVKELKDGSTSQSQGVYYVTWNGRDHIGKELANGIYLCEVWAKASAGGLEERKFRRIAVYRK